MSVINKMLRDLDQRQASGGGETALPDPALRRGTATVPSGDLFKADKSTVPVSWLVAGGFALAVAGLTAAAWWWQRQQGIPASPPVQVVAALAPAPVPATAPVVPAPQQAPPAPVLQAASAPVAAQALPASALEKPVSALPSPVGSVTVAKSSPTQVPAPVVALRMDKSLTLHGLADTPVAGRAASAAATERPKIAPTTAVAPSAAHPAAASNEALAQAQNLWNAGSRDAAIDLLRDAVALAARSGTVGVGANGNALLLPLVREVTRMQLADSRYAAVWDLLTQLESQLGNQADLWAIRAHAAQRLGRHQDSVHAYMAALQSRPNEQRWLLGAAVSLAALGQTESASEMADKARAVGPVSKDVQVYLRQMNVPLKDQ